MCCRFLPRSSRAFVSLIVLVTLAASCSGDAGDRASAPDASADSAEAVVPVKGSQGCGAGDVPEAGTTQRTIQHGEHTRTYLLTVPEGYDGVTPAPVVLNLHGVTGTGEKVNATSRMPERAGARGYLVVAPDGLDASIDATLDDGRQIEGGLWDISPAFHDPAVATTTTVAGHEIQETDDVSFINELLDSIEAEMCVDPSREYSTGKSNGAGMTTVLACEPAPRFAAVAPVAGVNMAKFCNGDDVPPVITFHGDLDEPMPYDGDEIVGISLGVPDVDTRMAELAAKQGCAEPADTQLADDVVHRVWSCPDGAASELYKVLGGGHTWPGEDPAGAAGLGVVTQSIDATDLILDFFDAHARR